MNGISLIIPLYNKEKTIANCLDKIFSQTLGDFEVIVVDDGSTDKSVDNLRGYRDRIELIRQENQGPSVARNNGVKAAKYNCLSFVDADDEITPGFVESHLAVRRCDPEIELSINSFKFFVEGRLERTENLFDRRPERASNKNYFIINQLDHMFCTNIHSSGYCINKELFIKASGFDEELKCWEISDALMRFSLQAKKIAILKDVLSLVFDDGNSLFKLENTNLEYKRKFCDNILRVMQEIPDSSKHRYFKEMEYLCYDYWRSLRGKELVSFYNKVLEQPDAKTYLTLPVKIRVAIVILRLVF